ncbi:MAG: outer membrane protein assembly factor BamA [Pseudomonadota bacterium]
MMGRLYTHLWPFWGWVIFLFLAVTLAPNALSAQSIPVNSIQVEGNQRVEAETIRVFSGLETGTAATEEQVNAAVQRLFDTGLFEDVSIQPSGGRVLITVVENPTINIINFEGNRRVDDALLEQVISLAPRQAFNRSIAERDTQAILEVYARQGRFGATVVPKLIRLDENRVNLVYEVFEGRVTEVQRIAFVGNEVYSDRRLRRVLATGQAGILSRFFTNDTYDPDRLELDRQRLREFYLNRGFVDFEIQSAAAELARERNAFFLTFRLSEGQRYSYGNLTAATTAQGLDPTEFEALIDLRPGQTYSAERVDRVVERMAFLAGQKGFAFVEVVPRVIRNPELQTVDIQFDLIEGPRVFIERIDIRGNRETVDRVIRRQFRVVEGDAFNSREVRRAEQRIQALRFFDRVGVRVREGSSADRAVITVDVEEAATGNIGFGAAFSTSDGITGTVNLSERNFLGRGQRVSLDLAAGADSQTVSFDFTEPALFDQDLSAGFGIFYRERELDESSIDTRSIGFTPRIGFPLTEDSRLTLRLRTQLDRISILGSSSISPILEREAGEDLTVSAGFRYVLDKRNSPVDPTAGFIFQLDQDIAGLAGDTQYSRTRGLLRGFTSVLDEDVVLSAELEGGALVPFNNRSRATDRFSLGGDSFRGFEAGGLGPRDRCNACGGSGGTEDVNDSLGGNLFAVARLEASFPVGLPQELGVFGGVFADVGTIWSLNDTAGAQGEVDDSARLRSSVGLSLFWDTAFGPLRFNYAVPVESVEGDQFERFRITVDTRF